MFQAYMVVPAFTLTYLVFSKEKVSKRFIAGGDKPDDKSNKNPQDRNVQSPGEQGNHGEDKPNGAKGGQGDDYISDPSPIRLWISSS